MRHFTPNQLKEYLAQGGKPLLLDVREPWDYEVCAIDVSELVPMRQIPSAAHDLDPAQETVVICHHGIRSRQVAYYLERMGFTDVVNLDGGVDAWARDVDPHMATY